MTDTPIPEPTTLIFHPWAPEPGWDPAHDARGLYVERVWCSVLGPTSTLGLRIIVSLLAKAPVVKVQAVDLAQLLGVPGGASKWGVLGRSLRRLEQFGAAQSTEPDTWVVRTHLPSLTERQLMRHGPLVRGFHHLLTSRPPTG